MPANKKGVGKSVHVIVDTLRHPAVELTQVEEAHRSQDSDHPESPGGDRNSFGDAADEWAVPAGIVAGCSICLTLLVIASLVIRRTRSSNVASRTVRSK